MVQMISFNPIQSDFDVNMANETSKVWREFIEIGLMYYLIYIDAKMLFLGDLQSKEYFNQRTKQSATRNLTHFYA